MAKAKHIYLGDGAYATLDKDAFHPLILTTGDHRVGFAENIIYLEAGVLTNLVKALEEEFPHEKNS